jgi:hypothetical protein
LPSTENKEFLNQMGEYQLTIGMLSVSIRKYKYTSNYTTVLISMIPMSCVRGDKKKALVLLVFFIDGSHSVVFTTKQAVIFVLD